MLVVHGDGMLELVLGMRYYHAMPTETRYTSVQLLSTNEASLSPTIPVDI